MVCLRGESLTHHIKQMKLFTAIASAAVIGASFLVPNPVEARNDWLNAGTSNEGVSHYIKPSGCSNGICSFTTKYSHKDWTSHERVNCNSWSIKVKVGTEVGDWEPIYPGSMADAKAELVCR